MHIRRKEIQKNAYVFHSCVIELHAEQSVMSILIKYITSEYDTTLCRKGKIV